jgi:hypothetical protein
VIDNSTSDTYDIVDVMIVQDKASSGEDIYVPTAIITNGTDIEVPIEELLLTYSIKDDSGTIAMLYNIGDKLVINEGGVKTEIIINDRTYETDSADPKYFISNLDGSKLREIFQSDLQSAFVEYWTGSVT